MDKSNLLKLAFSAFALVAASMGVVSLLNSNDSAGPKLRKGHRSLGSLDVEVVLAHYAEKLDWIEEAQLHNPDVLYTTYSKGPQPPENTIHLENVGRESHTFLYHIIRNYDSLAKWTVFSQAARPNFGFIFHNQESGHMCSGVKWGDYLEPNPNGEDFFMVQTVATQFPQVWHSDRIDMMFRMPDSKGDVCPPNGEMGWGGWWADEDHPLVKFQNTEEGKDSLSAMDFYNKYIVADASDATYKSATLNYANGGRFAASRERIHSRPLSYYMDLLDQLSKHVNPIEGFYMETMWYDVFHPDRLQAEYGSICGLPALPEVATGHPEMHREAIQRTFGNLLPRMLQASGPYLDAVDMDARMRQLQASGAYTLTKYLQASGPYLDTLTRHLQVSGPYLDSLKSVLSGAYLDN